MHIKWRHEVETRFWFVYYVQRTLLTIFIFTIKSCIALKILTKLEKKHDSLILFLIADLWTHTYIDHDIEYCVKWHIFKKWWMIFRDFSISHASKNIFVPISPNIWVLEKIQIIFEGNLIFKIFCLRCACCLEIKIIRREIPT